MAYCCGYPRAAWSPRSLSIKHTRPPTDRQNDLNMTDIQEEEDGEFCERLMRVVESCMDDERRNLDRQPVDGGEAFCQRSNFPQVVRKDHSKSGNHKGQMLNGSSSYYYSCRGSPSSHRNQNVSPLVDEDSSDFEEESRKSAGKSYRRVPADNGRVPPETSGGGDFDRFSVSTSNRDLRYTQHRSNAKATKSRRKSPLVLPRISGAGEASRESTGSVVGSNSGSSARARSPTASVSTTSSSGDLPGAPYMPLNCRVDPYTAEITGHNTMNRSFSSNEQRRIRRENQNIVRRILAQQRVPRPAPSMITRRPASSAINRKERHRQIEYENEIIKRRLLQIQRKTSRLHVAGVRTRVRKHREDTTAPATLTSSSSSSSVSSSPVVRSHRRGT